MIKNADEWQKFLECGECFGKNTGVTHSLSCTVTVILNSNYIKIWFIASAASVFVCMFLTARKYDRELQANAGQ